MQKKNDLCNIDHSIGHSYVQCRTTCWFCFDFLMYINATFVYRNIGFHILLIPKKIGTEKNLCPFAVVYNLFIPAHLHRAPLHVTPSVLFYLTQLSSNLTKPVSSK